MRSWWKILLGVAFASIGIGIVITLLGFTFGRGHYVKSGDRNYSYTDTVDQVSSISLDVKFSTVKIVNGDQFSVEVKNMEKDGFESYVKDGTWYLEDNYDRAGVIHLFGFEVPISDGWFLWDFGNNSIYSPEILVTIPKDFVASNYELSIGAGELTAEVLNAENCELKLGAGKMTLKQLNVTSNTKLEVGAGAMVVSKLVTQDGDFNCGFGSIIVDGEVLSNLSADCGMGEIRLDLDGKEEDYNYDINCGLGSVKLNSHNYGGITSDTINYPNAKGNYKFNCGMGSINVRIR